MKTGTFFRFMLSMVTGLCAAAALICAFWEPLLKLWAAVSSREIKIPHSVGVIGGADGPTAIFVSSSAKVPQGAAFAFGGAALLGGVLLLLSAKKKK